MTLCVVLDGWHAGHIVPLPDAPPTIKLYKPAVKTWCGCNAEGEVRPESVTDADIREYQITFHAPDGKVALYSEHGDSETILRTRDWIAGQRGLLAKPEPLYWNTLVHKDCHEPGAWE